MDRLRWTSKFLSIATKEVAKFNKPNQKTFMDAMNCSVNAFADAVRHAPEQELEHALVCLINNEWDQSNFIMSLENKFL